MEYAVEIKNLSKDYETGFWKKKRVRALDNLTLNVKPGQIFGFLGGNGAGKTTTIKMLMRLIFPTEGSAKILGHDIADVQMHRRIGYCPENPYFYDYLTAKELMGYFGELFGYDKTTAGNRSRELLQRVGLAEKDWNRQLRKFSKGMLQRVGIAQSLINDPEIVFLDEPMSGLDPIGRREIRELIAELRTRGKTVFMSTHILSDIEALCDEVAILRNGKLGATGNLMDLLKSSGEERNFEVVVSGVLSDGFGRAVSEMGARELLPEPNGATIVVPEDGDLTDLIALIERSGGKLVSIQPLKQSLEELFVDTAG